MDKIQTFAVKVKNFFTATWDKAVGLVSRNSQKVANGARTAKVTFKSRISAIRTMVADKGLTGVLLTGLRSVARTFGWMILIEAVLRVVLNPKGVTKLWTDWRNNPRRLVSLLWSALTLTAAAYVLSFTWMFWKAICLALLAVFAVCLIWDYVSQLVNKERDAEASARHFKPARVAMRWAYLLLLGFAAQIASWTPQVIADYIAPAYAATATEVKTEEAVQQVKDVFSEVYEDAKENIKKTTTAPDGSKTEEVFDSEKVFSSASLTIDGEVEEVDVEIDGTVFHKAPYKAGRNLARKLLEDHGMEVVRKYHSQIAQDLYAAQLPQSDVLNAVRGFESVMPKVDA